MNIKKKELDIFHDILFDDYLMIVRQIKNKRSIDVGYRKHKDFGKVTPQIITKKKSMKPDEALSESSSDDDDPNKELKIPEHLSSDKHNKLPKFGAEQKTVTAYYFLNMLQKKDEELSVSMDEFTRINFPNEWPKIMRDVCLALTGQDALVSAARIREQDEVRNLGMQDLCKESDLAHFKERDVLNFLYYTGMQSFRVLQGRDTKHVMHTKKELEQYAATVSAGATFSET